jgi:hypothetical protein
MTGSTDGSENQPSGGADKLRPAVNTAITGDGIVVAHERVIDSVGKYHGLNKVIIQGEKYYPDLNLWKKMLPRGADITRVEFDPEKLYKSVVFYKVVQDGNHPFDRR